MTAHQVRWNGTQEELFELVNAVARNCACEFGILGMRIAACAPHQMLLEDQRALNGLLFARRIAERLRGEEWLRLEPEVQARSGPWRASGPHER